MAEDAVVLPLLPTLAPCPRCGARVLVRLWHGVARAAPACWEDLTPPRTPVLGEEHGCIEEEEHVDVERE